MLFNHLSPDFTYFTLNAPRTPVPLAAPPGLPNSIATHVQDRTKLTITRWRRLGRRHAKPAGENIFSRNCHSHARAVGAKQPD
jgi:hypothetical protein